MIGLAVLCLCTALFTFGVAKLQDELVANHGALSFDDPVRTPPTDDPDYVMTFLGVPLYRKWDAVMGAPWMDL